MTSIQKKSSVLLYILIIGVMVGLSVVAKGQHVITISSGKVKSIKVVAPNDKDIMSTANYLRNYLAERSLIVDGKIYNKTEKNVSTSEFIMATESTLKDVIDKEVPELGFSPDAHPDSYILDARRLGNRNIIYLIGKTPSGVTAAVGRFISKMMNDGKTISIKEGREQKSPFINIRLAALAPTARRQIKIGSVHEDANYELWDDNRLCAYPELFRQFGFSGIQVMEIRGYGSISGEYLKKAQNAVKMLATGAKDLGMFVSLDQWGDCPFVEGKAFCWEDPEEKKVLTNFFTELAQHYGGLVDHVYIHAGDPGGATHKGCTKFKSPQLLTAAVLDIFKKYNPKVLGTMSTWANSTFWKHNVEKVDLSNYDSPFQHRGIGFGQSLPDGARFLDDTWMPKEIGLALHRRFNQEQADLLAKVGRPIDVWGWYVGDMEMHNNITLNTKNIDKYYSALPQSAAGKIRMQTIELCFHGWPQIINTYAGAQKMWDPYRNIIEIEKEFCMAAFGPANAEPMLDLYHATENPWDYEVMGKPNQHLPRPADLGTPAGIARLKKVLIDAKAIRFDKNWKPNFAFPVDVQKYVEMLMARLTFLIAYSEAMQKVQEAKASGQTAAIAQIKKDAIASMPVLPIDPLYTKDGSSAKQHFVMAGWSDYINKL